MAAAVLTRMSGGANKLTCSPAAARPVPATSRWNHALRLHGIAGSRGTWRLANARRIPDLYGLSGSKTGKSQMIRALTAGLLGSLFLGQAVPSASAAPHRADTLPAAALPGDEFEFPFVVLRTPDASEVWMVPGSVEDGDLLAETLSLVVSCFGKMRGKATYEDDSFNYTHEVAWTKVEPTCEEGEDGGNYAVQAVITDNGVPWNPGYPVETSGYGEYYAEAIQDVYWLEADSGVHGPASDLKSDHRGSYTHPVTGATSSLCIRGTARQAVDEHFSYTMVPCTGEG